MQPKPPSSEQREIVELKDAEQALRMEEAFAREGHTARTLVREDDLRVVLIAMRAGGSMEEHHTDHTAVIHVLNGEVKVRFGGRAVDVAAGCVFFFERGAVHAVEAAVDSAFLLTLGWRGKDDRG